MSGSFGISFISSCVRGALLFALGCIGAALEAKAADPNPALLTARVAVPDHSMETPPFDTARKLLIPPEFSFGVYARVDGARFMAVAPTAICWSPILVPAR